MRTFNDDSRETLYYRIKEVNKDVAFFLALELSSMEVNDLLNVNGDCFSDSITEQFQKLRQLTKIR